MKRAIKKNRNADMLPEYDFSKGVRGKYARRYNEGSNIVVLSPDVALVFPDSKTVNDILRTLIKINSQISETRFGVEVRDLLERRRKNAQLARRR